jgi:glycosyltransferase involved in cell wall biosynthesis
VTVIGVVVPAYNEEKLIGDCLRSLQVAAACPMLLGEDVRIVVVLDGCSDGTDEVVRDAGAMAIISDARNVGVARSVGADAALALGARWLAFTDADSVVARDWLSLQLALRHDAVCGTVAVADWNMHSEAVAKHHSATYLDADGHRHVHGANLGVDARAYRRSGGFQPLACSEDVALVHALESCGASIAWSAAPRVFTSARRDYRIPGGFGAALESAGRLDLKPGAGADFQGAAHGAD